MKQDLLFLKLSLGALILGFCALAPKALYEQYSLLTTVFSAQHWPIADGTISSVDRKEVGSYRRGVDGYQVIVHFDYKINGSSFSNEQREFLTAGKIFTNSLFNESDSTALAARFHAGKSLPVHYNPTNPAQSFVDTEVSWPAFVPFLSVGFFSIVLIAALNFFFNKARAKEKSG